MTDHDPPATPPPPGPVPTPEDAQSYDQGAVGAVAEELQGAPVAPTDHAPSAGSDHAEGTEAPEPEPDPLQQVAAERDDYLDQLQRARADYDNLNKRRLREVAEARDRGVAALAEAMLVVLDNFGFALQAAETSEDTQLAKGVRLVHTQLLEVLSRAGLQEIAGVGEVFDPSLHEALFSESDDTEREHPEVAEVLRTGYRFKSQLLRPASVKVWN
ncbi:MAG: nucleotide exchange factor GrpE [Euzebya sp.]